MENTDFTCSYEGCQKTYSNAFNLKRHVESFHLNIKKFFCAICHKGLSSKQNMREHSFIHQGSKPYNCRFPNCQEAFRQLSQLKLHESIHREIEKHMSLSKSKYLINLSVFNEGLKGFSIESLGESVLNGFELPKMMSLKEKFEFENDFKF